MVKDFSRACNTEDTEHNIYTIFNTILSTKTLIKLQYNRNLKAKYSRYEFAIHIKSDSLSNQIVVGQPDIRFWTEPWSEVYLKLSSSQCKTEGNNISYILCGSSRL